MTASGATEAELTAATPSASSSRFVRLYGERPRHLIAMLACFALTGSTVLRIVDDPALTRIAVWFVGAALVWDLVVGPAFALADRALLPLRSRRVRGVASLNVVRIPAMLSALLFMVWAPVILQRSEDTFRNKSGLSQDVFLGRWLVITAVLFAVSGLVWGIAVLRASRRTP